MVSGEVRGALRCIDDLMFAYVELFPIHGFVDVVFWWRLCLFSLLCCVFREENRSYGILLDSIVNRKSESRRWSVTGTDTYQYVSDNGTC